MLRNPTLASVPMTLYASTICHSAGRYGAAYSGGDAALPNISKGFIQNLMAQYFKKETKTATFHKARVLRDWGFVIDEAVSGEEWVMIRRNGDAVVVTPDQLHEVLSSEEFKQVEEVGRAGVGA